MRLFLILLPALAPAVYQETPVFRSSVFLVRLDAQVVEGKRVVGGLEREDFLVLEDGRRREIDYFGRESDPLWLLLLMDVSGSMRRNLKDMAAASGQVLKQMAARDRVAVMLFGQTTRLSQDFTGETALASKALWEALGERSVGSGTAINAAILDAAAHIRTAVADQPGRRAILILTDNKGLNYRAPDEKAMDALSEAGAVLNAILSSEARAPEKPKNAAGLNPDFTPPDVFRLAEESGGEAVKSSKAGEAFEEMLERIRTRYSLHYRAPEGEPGTRRKVEVRLSDAARPRHKRAEVRSRRSYTLPR